MGRSKFFRWNFVSTYCVFMHIDKECRILYEHRLLVALLKLYREKYEIRSEQS